MRIIWYKNSLSASIVSIIGCLGVILGLAAVRSETETVRVFGIAGIIIGLIMVLVARGIASDKLNLLSKEEKNQVKAVTNLLVKAEEARKAGDSASEVAALQPLAASASAPISMILRLGAAYIRAKDYDNAVETYKRAIKKDPKCAQAYAGAASVYIIMGKFSESLNFAQRSVSLTPETSSDYAVVMANYALAVGKCGDVQSAEEALKKAEAAGYKNGDTIRAAINS